MRLYQLAFYNHAGELQTAMDLRRTVQLRYSRQLNGFGAIQFTVPLADAHPCLLTLDTVCVVYFADGGGPMIADGAYFLRKQNPLPEGDLDFLVIGGYSVEYILRGNIFIAEDDPLEANGFSTKSGDASTVMWEIVNEQCVNPAVNSARAIPNLVMATDPATGDFVAFREEDSDTKIIEFLKKLARSGSIDFWVEYDPAGPEYTVYFGVRGKDKRKSTNYPTSPYLYFSPALGNIDQPSLDVDRRDEQNVVHVFGQGPAGTRLRYMVAGQGVNDSPWNRKEFGVQARNTKNLDDWQTEAANALAEERAKLTTFTFLPKATAPGALYYTDWRLGDLVTASYQEQEFEMRITGAETNVSDTEAFTSPEMELL